MPKMMAARSHHREITSSTGSALPGPCFPALPFSRAQFGCCRSCACRRWSCVVAADATATCRSLAMSSHHDAGGSQATRSKLLLPCVSFSFVCRLKKEKQPAAGHRLDRGRTDLEEALP
jgi:hypothetical protein